MEATSPEVVVNWINVIGIGCALALTFVLVFKEAVSRTTALLIGAALCIIWGTARGFFPAEAALASVSMQTLILLVTMTVISNTLDAGGIFNYLGIRILQLAGGNRRRLFILLCLFTYAVSLVADNLTVMVILGALTVGLLAELCIDPRPFVTGVLISTNTGGASTAIGDFPNLILSERAGIPFLAFVEPLGMFWICLLIQVAAVTFLCWQFRDALQTPDDLPARLAARFSVNLVAHRLPAVITSRRAVIGGAVALVLAIVMFGTSGSLHHLSPSEIALIAAIVAMMASGFDHEQLIDDVGLRHVMAFVGLFVLAGAADHTGIIQALGVQLLAISGGNPLVVALLILVPVAVVTAVVDAGPSTAAFLPLMLSLTATLDTPGYLLYWALSLGVLAGSSATILGATAGTIAAGQVDRWFRATSHHSEFDPERQLVRHGYVAAFSRSGIPVAALMLLCSAGFLTLAFWWYGY